jgi:peroxiredoxin
MSSVPPEPQALAAGEVRPATAEEVAVLGRLLARSGRAAAPHRPTVIFAYPGHGVGEVHPDLAGCTNQTLLLSTAVASLGRLGVDVLATSTETADKHAHRPDLHGRVLHAGPDTTGVLPHVVKDEGTYLLRATFLFEAGGAVLVATGITDSVAHTKAVLALIEQQRLRSWAAQVWPAATGAVELRGTFANGADSDGIVAFGTEASTAVAKVGPAGVLDAEATFLRRANLALDKASLPPMFPVVHAVTVEGDQAVVLMEAGRPDPLDDLVFADKDRFELDATAGTTLSPFLDRLTRLHQLTRAARAPETGPYLYFGRFEALVAHPDFVAAHGELLPGAPPIEDLLTARLLLPGGVELPSYRELLTWLASRVDRIAPQEGALIHGDPHFRNMLFRDDDEPMLIDPRTVWDGRAVTDPGFGDPAYDFATLLHSAFPMSALLHAIEQGNTVGYFPGGVPHPVNGRLDLTTTPLPFVLPARANSLAADLVRRLGVADASVAETRLNVGAANALVGWLKYARALRTGEAWLAVFAYTVWYLDRGRVAAAGW